MWRVLSCDHSSTLRTRGPGGPAWPGMGMRGLDRTDDCACLLAGRLFVPLDPAARAWTVHSKVESIPGQYDDERLGAFHFYSHSASRKSCCCNTRCISPPPKQVSPPGVAQRSAPAMPHMEMCNVPLVQLGWLCTHGLSSGADRCDMIELASVVGEKFLDCNVRVPRLAKTLAATTRLGPAPSPLPSPALTWLPWRIQTTFELNICEIWVDRKYKVVHFQKVDCNDARAAVPYNLRPSPKALEDTFYHLLKRMVPLTPCRHDPPRPGLFPAPPASLAGLYGLYSSSTHPT